MALIERHPEVEDYFVELTLAEIGQRPDGIADLYEDGRLVIIRDYRLPFDFKAMALLDNRVDRIADKGLRKRVKKLESPKFFEGAPPEIVANGPGGTATLRFADPVRQAMFDTLCRGDRAIFDRAAGALKKAHDEIERIFAICFPRYDPFRLIASLRLTETLFENLHWDIHSIDDDFHQARIFCNLDTRRRIWNLSHNFIDMARSAYVEHDLARFAGRDPNLMLDYIAKDILGGSTAMWKDRLPRHRIAFEPGEVWLGESRMLGHQIYYGERAIVYMWFVRLASMNDAEKRFNRRVETLHESMAAAIAAVAG